MLIKKQYDHENVSYKIISKDDISRAVKKVHSNKASITYQNQNVK